MREDDSRIFGVTGRRGAAVSVEVGPARGQPVQQQRAGEWDMICLYLDIWLLNIPLYLRLVG